MKMSERVIEKVREFAESLLPSMNLELFDIQFRQEDRGWVLRLFIDNEDGVSVDHCAQVSREISAYLEVEDVIEHAYHLEISSPGLERPLRSAEEFGRFVGQAAKIKLHLPVNKQKVFIGTIEMVGENGQITLQPDDSDTITFTMDDINQARLYLR